MTGHSFLPSDRVFGFIEKKLKKREVIATREEIYDLISEHGKVKHVGKDCDVADFRTTTRNNMKETKNFHFKISQCKRIYVKLSKKFENKVLVRGELTYNSDQQSTHYKSLMKSQKNAFDLHPDRIQEKNFVSREKKRDVNQLLIKHYGNDWRDIEHLEFFKQVIDNATPTTEEGEQTAEVFDCGCEEDETNMVGLMI